MAGEQPIIDVERLVAELKERVARDRAAGKYAAEIGETPLEVLPPLAVGFDLDGGSPHIRFRPELGFSSKPVIGPVITVVKKLLLRLLFFTLDDLAQQSDAAVQRLQNALAAEIAAREAVVSAEIAAREGLQASLGALSQRIAGLAIPERLARLERERRPTPRPQAAPNPASAEQPAAPAPGLDYLTFEERFRPQESVRERQQIYLELLRDRERVADLGCGRGELLDALRGEGVSAYGVEIEPDFVALLEEAGIDVVEQDAVEHLDGLEAGAVDGIVVSHVVEHLPAAALVRLVSLAADKLADGGVLIVETPNPESLLAGSVNFHRDPTHVRPIHPDTLAFLCESAGFSEIEVRRLSPVPPQHALPVPAEGGLREIVTQLNDLLYGYQDYAVVARR